MCHKQQHFKTFDKAAYFEVFRMILTGSVPYLMKRIKHWSWYCTADCILPGMNWSFIHNSYLIRRIKIFTNSLWPTGVLKVTDKSKYMTPKNMKCSAPIRFAFDTIAAKFINERLIIITIIQRRLQIRIWKKNAIHCAKLIRRKAPFVFISIHIVF